MAIEYRINFKDNKGKHRIKVGLVCDTESCGHKYETSIDNYYQYKKRHNGSNYCRKCAAKKVGEKAKGRIPYNKGKKYPERCREKSATWKGGRYMSSDGYWMVYYGKRDYKTESGWLAYKKEHIVVIEEKIGRKVERGEVVHHIDGDKLNNSPDNLHLYPSHVEHRDCHSQLQELGYKLYKDGILGFEDGKYFIKEVA
jgi:hypothetical protein